MLIFISGQAGSGKSRYAEERLSLLSGHPKIYVAMSPVVDDEMRARVRKHQAMRAGKGFLTVERERDLSGVNFPAGSSVLVESLTAWTANVMFSGGHVVNEIFGDFLRVLGRVKDTIIVSDDIFSDGGEYDAQTEEFMRGLAELTLRIAGIADEVIEVVAGMPITYNNSGGE